jgi:hypothetical protein
LISLLQQRKILQCSASFAEIQAGDTEAMQLEQSNHVISELTMKPSDRSAAAHKVLGAGVTL